MMLTCHIFLGLPTILPKMKVVAIVYLFAKLASLCLPSVSPLSPLLALCLLFSLLALACRCCLAWFPLLLHRWKLLSLTVLKRMRKRVATKEFVRRLRGSVSQNLISDLVWTWFAPRSDLVKIAASQNPARRGFGKALQWSAAWSAAGLLLGLLLLLLLSLLVLLLLGKARFLGREARDLWKGWKLLPASELVHFDRRCANRISTWRKISDVWRKRCAMRLAQVLVNGVGINVHVWISVHMVFNIRGYIFLRLWDITVHTRPDGDLENLAIEKCTARDLKVTLLHSASHGVLDLVALTCLTSWMRGVPCSFYLRSTYALTFTSPVYPLVMFVILW